MLWSSLSCSSSSSSSSRPQTTSSLSQPQASLSSSPLRLFLITWLVLITIHPSTLSALEARMSKSLSRGRTYYFNNNNINKNINNNNNNINNGDDNNDDDDDDDASYHHDNRMEAAALLDEPGNHKDAEVDDDDGDDDDDDGSPEGRRTEWENESRLFPRFLDQQTRRPPLTFERSKRQTINHWSQSVHDSIVTIATKATSISDIQTDFLMAPMKLSEVDGLKLLLMYKERLEGMLRKKSDALERIVRKAEESFSQYVQTAEVQTNYPKAKNLSDDFELSYEMDRDFGVPVNKSHSSVHVPTNVYDESTPILHGVVWSKPLDEVFARNYEEDSGLSWQFFASSAGFLRIFPGTRWPKQPDDIDLHDSRLEPWYIRAANSPKDAVILIDSSGSMRGLRREIARTTVEKIVQTFGVDDFFNVIKFSDVLEYLDPCNNGSLIQGTASNKQAVLEALKTGMKTANMANYVLAFSEAFELLNRYNRNQSKSGSGCNKLVMLITDGVTEKYETLFQSFQEKWPKSNVRIFTYLIGREVADAEKVKWIACHNKGYHSHISTMADVHEHIQEYIHVVSRPMVMSRADHVVWTTNHMNILKGQATMTISRPVYDTREKMFSAGSLVGVAAIDVPMSELVREIPIQELGANGYAFLVTNNGHVLLHPKLKLQMTELHDIKTMDISNIEFDDAEIRKKTINRETGLIKLKSKFTSFDNKRIFVQNRWYAFAPIEDTSFSLCLSLPSNPVTLLSGEGVFNEHHDFTLDFRTSHFKLAPWFYCKMRSNLESPPSFPSRGWFHLNAQQLSHEEELLLAIEKSKLNSSINWEPLASKCNTNLLQQLLFDSMATRSVVPNWLKSDNIHGSNQKLSERYGIESLFLMTKSGLTRYYHFQTNQTEPAYLEYDTNPSTSDHYLRTSMLPEGSFVFSVPFFKGHQNLFQDFNFGSFQQQQPQQQQQQPQQQQQQHQQHQQPKQLHPLNDLEKTLVTASSAIFISSDHHSAMVGVVSLQMRLSKFNDLFIQALTSQADSCKKEGHSELCNISCLDNEVLQCYLIDENGFIIASHSPGQDVGRFFGEVKNLQSIAEDLIYELDDKGFEKGIFKLYSIFDYQDICQIWKMVTSGAQLSGLHILSKVFESLTYILQNLFVFLKQLPLFLWCICLRIACGEDENQYPYFVLEDLNFEPNSTTNPDYFEYFDQTMIPFHLELLANNNSELLDSLMEDWRKMIFDKKSNKDILDWFKEKYEQYKPQAIGLRPCTRKYNLYKAQFHVLPYHGVSESCLDSSLECRRLFSAAQVPQTNLILLAVDGSCDCDVITKVSIEPIEVADDACNGRTSMLFRKRPSDCFSDHEGEDSLKCKASNSAGSLFIQLIAPLLWRTMQKS